MTRKLLLAAATAALPLASIPAQAAPLRTSSPVAAQSEGLTEEAGGAYLIAATLAAVILIVLLVDGDDNDNEVPATP